MKVLNGTAQLGAKLSALMAVEGKQLYALSQLGYSFQQV
jgi:hypothetical protein